MREGKFALIQSRNQANLGRAERVASTKCTDGAGHLRRTGDRVFDFVTRSSSDQQRFVDDNYEVRHARPCLAGVAEILDRVAAFALGVIAINKRARPNWPVPHSAVPSPDRLAECPGRRVLDRR